MCKVCRNYRDWDKFIQGVASMTIRELADLIWRKEAVMYLDGSLRPFNYLTKCSPYLPGNKDGYIFTYEEDCKPYDMSPDREYNYKSPEDLFMKDFIMDMSKERIYLAYKSSKPVYRFSVDIKQLL
jgi:hypothetical protein